MPLDQTSPASTRPTALPRAEGALALTTKSARRAGGMSTLPDTLRTSGCLRALFPRHPSRCEAIVINTSGGLTGGDRLSLSAHAGAGTHLTLTSQAAERAYRASSGEARVTTRLSAAPGACLQWLPQELILFNGAALSRRLSVELEPGARALIVEPVVFGRPAMGETVTQAHLFDRIHINRCGAPLFRDASRLSGNIAAQLAHPAVGNGAGAMAALIYVNSDAEAHLDPIRAALPKTAGASLLAPDTLVARFLAEDAFALRQTFLPVLDRLSGSTLPTSWRL